RPPGDGAGASAGARLDVRTSQAASPLREVAALARQGTASLTIKLVALVGIFLALPIVLYGQFETADRKTRELVTSSIQNRSWLIAQALRPALDRAPAAS